MIPQPIELLGVPIHPVSQSQLVDLLVAWGADARQRHVYHVNVHAMNLAIADQSLRFALRRADLVFCDGYGVKWGGALAGVRIPYRLTPPDWIDQFAAATARAEQSVFALGDEKGVADAFQASLRSRHSDYLDAGSLAGFFEKEGPENDEVIDVINNSGAAHLLVGFGMPMQELWLQANAHRLKPRVLLPVGALFRWYTGKERRAPRWMTDHGLEWVGRLLRHPLRHFKRYATGNPLFIYRILRARLTRNRE